MKIFIRTLGCFKNEVDSEMITSRLLSFHTLTDDPRSADIIIINTCAFIEEAKQESIDQILSYGDLKGKKIIVSGCLGQRYGAEILEEIPEVDAVVGTYAFHRILDVIERVGKSE
ncbi:MAG: 30S ribosomal protein S12 methylthiotransferase RimO, partial [Candidatus Cloacimonadota bacterium]